VATAPRYGSDLVVDLLRAVGVEHVALNPGATFRGLHDSLVNYGGGRAPGGFSRVADSPAPSAPLPPVAPVRVDAYAPDMARGIGENPARSPTAHLQAVDYPATRDELVQTAADNEAPVEVINFLKSLPKQRYASYEEALRDFAEAERRFGVGNHAEDGPSREDIGKKAVESPDAPTHHP